MSKIVEFLQELNGSAARYVAEMENIMFQDPSSALVKARSFAEVILNDVFNLEKIDEPSISTFYEKVSYLTRHGYINRDIQKSFDTIRISGNKAAHPNEHNEIAEAYKLHKEMFNITVWYFDYFLTDLRVPIYEIPTPSKSENIEEIVRKKVEELLGKQLAEIQSTTINGTTKKEQDIDDTNKEQTTTVLKKDLIDGESYLLWEIRRLKDSSKEAIENAENFSYFKEYLHVDRRIQLDLEMVLEDKLEKKEGNLILLCGNVGDGKSHLLAYLKDKKPEVIEQYTIHNDATESFSPNKDAMETLSELLSGFSDQKLNSSNDKVILAINMGVLHNFISTEHENYTYNSLKEFVEESKLFTTSITTYYGRENFDLLSFGDYHSYELTEEGAISNFYSSLLEKITSPSEENPFYLGKLEDENNGIHTMVHQNFDLLQNKVVKDCIIQLLIESIIKKKLVISARAFLNFIADIIIPDEIRTFDIMSEFDVLKDSLPNLLFIRKDRSQLLNAIGSLDPLHRRSVYIDQFLIDLSTLDNWEIIINKNIKDERSRSWLNPFLSNETLVGYSFNIFTESFIRLAYLTNNEFSKNIADQSYNAYVKNLYYFNKKETKRIKVFYEEIKRAIFNWKGSPTKHYIYLNKPSEKFRLAQKIGLHPTVEHLSVISDEMLESFKATITIGYNNRTDGSNVFLEIDYSLYSLLMKVKKGYRPNKRDEEDAIKFVEFIDKLMAFGEKKEELLVFFKDDRQFYSLKKDDFGSFVFEKESNYNV